MFKRMEHDADFGETELHGSSGPLWVERRARIADFTGWEGAFRDACLDLGYPASDDLNRPDAYGVSPFPWTIKNGRRQSAAIAYLEPIRQRRNLTILDEATVTAVELVGESAVGVRYTRDGHEHRASVGEIVLCAGVYHSPQVLMLSGIGPGDELRRHGIEVRAPLPEVGENLQDHASVFPTFEWRHDGSVEWPGICPVLLAKSDESRGVVDLHVIPRGPISIHGMRSIAPLGVYLLEQRNRGRLTLASGDPTALPVIEPRILDDEEDLEAIVAGMRLVCRLVETPPLRRYYGPLFQPKTDEDWRDYARRTYDSYHHGAGTCRMGPSGNPGAVVDARLRVRGIQQLRVADASIMPTIVHAPTNLTTMMIGERCADFILGRM